MDAGEQFVIMAGAAMMPGLSASMYIHLSCHLVHCAKYTYQIYNDHSERAYTSCYHHNVLPVSNLVFCTAC